MEDIMVKDARDLMNLETIHWSKIAKELNSSNIAKYSQDGHAYKF